MNASGEIVNVMIARPFPPVCAEPPPTATPDTYPDTPVPAGVCPDPLSSVPPVVLKFDPECPPVPPVSPDPPFPPLPPESPPPPAPPPPPSPV